MTREQAIDLIHNDPETAIQSLMRLDTLIKTVVSLQQRVSYLENDVKAKDIRIKELEAQLNQNSNNSSKPPSSDGARKSTRPKSARKSDPNKKGGQPGHKGDTLKKRENPDHTVQCIPASICPCGASLDSIPGKVVENRQVFDIPEPVVEVTEYQRIKKICPCCQASHEGSFPNEVAAPTQYGLNIRAMAIYLNLYQLIPLERVTQCLHHLFNIENICQDTILNWTKLTAGNLAGTIDEIKEKLIQCPIIHADETGFRINNVRQWLHSVSTKDFTFYYHHEKRGKEAHLAGGILNRFTGSVVSDGFSSYKNNTFAQILCNAHHLRELAGIAENDENAAEWAQNMIKWLKKCNRLTDEYAEKEDWISEDLQIQLEKEFHELLDFGIEKILPAENNPHKRGRPKQSKAYNLLQRMFNDTMGCIRFIFEREVPFDNNLAERDIRMMKLKEKISGCFRTKKGAEIFCIIRSFVSTMIKQGKNIFFALKSTIKNEAHLVSGGW